MTAALLLLAAATASGAALTLLWDSDGPLLPRLAAGAAVGMAALGLVGYPLAAGLGLRLLSVALAGAVVAAPLLLLGRPKIRARLRAALAASATTLRRSAGTPGAWLRAASLVFLAIVLLRCFDRTLFLTPEGLYTGVDHNLGDLPFHLAIIQGFDEGGRFPPEHPDLAGVRLTYSFLNDFVAALLVRAGASLREAFVLQNGILALALLVLLHRCALRLTANAAVAALVPWLVLLNGGLGFTDLLREVDPTRGGLVGLLAHLPHDYTIRFDGGLRFGNLVTTLLMTQRAFLLGLPLAILATTLLWEALTAEDGESARPRFLAAGVVAGIMPLAHVHSFAVVIGAAACLAYLFGGTRRWVSFFVPAAVLALPVVGWMAYGSPTQASRFLGWHLGWDRGESPALAFWIRNAGVFLILAVAGFLRGGPDAPAPVRLRGFLLPFALCFLAPNFVQLSPWIWDNIKILIYGYVFAAPLVALLLAWLWRKGRWSRAAAVALGLAAVLSGALDVSRVATRQIAHRLFDSKGLAFARAVTAATPPHALILHAPSHDTPLFLAGRRSFFGFPGHLASQGLDSGTREADLARIYAGADDATSRLQASGVEYLVLGPQERALLQVDEGFLARYPVIVQVEDYRLFDVRDASR